MLTASILRELPSAREAGGAAVYRLVVACEAATHEGEMQLSWAPAPMTGSLVATVDGKTSFTYQVEGAERMGNGSRAITGPAAVTLYESRKGFEGPRMICPVKALAVSDLFPKERVEFPFGELPESFGACFEEGGSGR